ncbi:MAG: hypothetical protein HY804_05020 [Nitrospinae bacterium]|nr:hypothetical protein [Nitrospinota bacterium]
MSDTAQTPAKKSKPAKTVTLNATTPLEQVAALASGRRAVTIDCGVLAMDGGYLNQMMKAARGAGVEEFTLLNVCGQNIVGTGVAGPCRIDVYGLMGNHSAAFVDKVTINTYPTTFPNGVWCPGDAQVAIGNTSNPKEMNIGGSVDDLFASYCPSGLFRVAGQGGNRCGLRAGAGVPHVWREIDYSQFAGLSVEGTKEELLYRYQQRRARVNRIGFQQFLLEYKQKVEDRQPPVIVFGRRVRDYFMEYAQGSIGVILNVYNVPNPAGYYICSGMTAGAVFIRGDIGPERLGHAVVFGGLTDMDREFLKTQIEAFYDTFNRHLTDSYQEKLDELMNRFAKEAAEVVGEFLKIVPGVDTD